MSQSGNKVKWCINKAKREIKEGRKHRGLIEIKPDIDEAKKHIQKAERNFKVTLYHEQGGFHDWAVSSIFYTIYHCFLAIITKKGYESRNQECTVALIEYLNEEDEISIDSRVIDALKASDNREKHESNVISLREDYQYGTETVIDQKKLSDLIELSKKAIEETKRIIYD